MTTQTLKQVEDILAAAWTTEHMSAAQAEGWDLFTTSDDDGNDIVQIQRIDDTDELPYGTARLRGDDVAMAIVMRGTSPHHVAAREIIKAHFPAEWVVCEAAIEEEG